jgi:hypothetical protein
MTREEGQLTKEGKENDVERVGVFGIRGFCLSDDVFTHILYDVVLVIQ